jgi:hypothetical protein
LEEDARWFFRKRITMSTVADYNNNPGNIKPPKGVTYDGQIGVDDRGFAIFENKDYGRKALIGDIEIKLKKGLTSPEAFINRYAPAGEENDEDARMNYKIFLADQLGLRSTADNFPENSAQKIADAIAHFESGTRPDQAEKKEATEIAATPKEGTQIASPDTTPAPMEISPAMAGYVGGQAGAAVGTGAILAKAKFDTAKEAKEAWDALRSKMPGATPAPDLAPTSAWPGSRTPATPSQAPVAPAQRLFEGAEDAAGLTGRERQTAYSEATSQRAAAAKTQEEIAKSLGLNPKQQVANYPSVSSTPSGTIITKELRDELAARELVRQQQEAERRAALQKQNVKAAQKAGEPWQKIVAQKAADTAKQPSPILAYARRLAGLPVKGALAGAGFASEAADAYNRYNKGEKGEAAVGGLGAVANLAAPFVGSMGALPSIGIAAPLYLTASDRIKRLAKNPEEIRLQEDAYDAMGNPVR